MYDHFPKRVLSDLPESIQSKFLEFEELDSSDFRVAKSFLEKTIIHPENTCDSVEQASSLLKFYMLIGAKIPQQTIEYMSSHSPDIGLIEQLVGYKNISSTIKVNMNTLPVQNQATSLLSFCHINRDRGLKRWNLYAENYGKLLKSIRRWCEFEATHLRPNCEYHVFLDDYHIGVIRNGKIFEPNKSSEMRGFIVSFFEPPVSMVFSFTITQSDMYGMRAHALDCSVGGEIKHSATLVLPNDPLLKRDLIKKSIHEVSRKILDTTRFQESMSCDIEADVMLNDVLVACVDIDGGDLKFTPYGGSFVDDFCGVVDGGVGDVVLEDNLPKKQKGKGVLAWLKNFLKG